MTANQALSLIVNAKLTTNQYKLIRKQARELNSPLYPPYYLVKNAKAACYPDPDDIVVKETYAEVKLQALLNHTVNRIACSQEEVINSQLSRQSFDSLTLISKWGCDGSSSQSTYKQKFSEEGEYSDEYLFSVSFVPLQLVSDHNVIIWQNPRPSSLTSETTLSEESDVYESD